MRCRTMLNTDCVEKLGSRVSSKALAKRSVSPIRSSNCRTGNSPVSLDRAAGEISNLIGREGRKSNENSPTDCKLMDGLRACAEVVSEHQLRRTTEPFC